MKQSEDFDAVTEMTISDVLGTPSSMSKNVIWLLDNHFECNKECNHDCFERHFSSDSLDFGIEVNLDFQNGMCLVRISDYGYLAMGVALQQFSLNELKGIFPENHYDTLFSSASAEEAVKSTIKFAIETNEKCVKFLRKHGYSDKEISFATMFF